MKEYWAVKAPIGELEGAIRDNETDAVLAWLSHKKHICYTFLRDTEEAWKHYQAKGYSVVCVRMGEVKKFDRAPDTIVDLWFLLNPDGRLSEFTRQGFLTKEEANKHLLDYHGYREGSKTTKNEWIESVVQNGWAVKKLRLTEVPE